MMSYRTIKIKTNVIIFILLFLFFNNCTTLIKTDNYKLYKLKVESNDLIKPNKKISNSPTFIIPFYLSKHTDCIIVSVIAETSNNKRVQCAFNIEKKIDLKKYKFNNIKYTFTTLSKNYNKDWDLISRVKFCSDSSKPFFELTEGYYIIRVTPFITNRCTFIVNIYSPEKITYTNKLN